MPLLKATSNGSSIVSTRDNAYAQSEPITQDGGDSDFLLLKNITSKTSIGTISNSNSSSTVTSGDETLVSSTNPFGDFSLLNKYNLNGNGNDSAGAINFTDDNVSDGTGVFSGSRVYNVSHSKALINNSDAVSISLFFKINSYRLSQTVIFTIGSPTGGTNRFCLSVYDTGVLNTTSYSSSSINLTELSYGISLGEWYHFVVSGSKVYINAVNEVNGESRDLTSDSTGLYLGANGAYDYGYIYDSSFGKPMDGEIDQLEIYNRELTEEEIKKLYYQSSTFTTQDILSSDTEIIDGDELILFTENETKYNIIANGVTGSGPYSLDTTSYTNGEIPNTIIKSDFENSNKIFFNDKESIILNNTLNSTDNLFKTDDIFNDGSIVTRFKFYNDTLDSTGNYSANIYRKNYLEDGGPTKKFISCPTNNDYITIPTLGSWFSNRTEFSITFNAKNSTSKNGVGATLALSFTTHVSPYYVLIIDVRNDQVTYRTNNETQISISKPAGYTDEWSSFGFTYKNGLMNLYGYGESTSILSGITLLDSTHSDLCFGRIPAGNSSTDASNLFISDFRLFDRELSENETKIIFSQTLHNIFSDNLHADIITSGRDIVTSVELDIENNTVNEISADIWKDN